MKEVPGELIEAARVDGAGHVQIFIRIMLPLMTPALAAFGIFQFLWVWNDLLVALVFGGGNLDIVAADRAAGRADRHPGHRPGTCCRPAPSSPSIVPLIVFLCLQRYFVRGLLAGSVKG